ncbi:MAG: RNA degradosome polyphosphate kinase [Streptosporangiales bacterium]|nr:RNA degradosome polyphosphate kinase [Streptosporangiales bacterium]
MALPRDFDLRTLLRAGESQQAKTPADLAAVEQAAREDPAPRARRRSRTGGDRTGRRADRSNGPGPRGSGANGPGPDGAGSSGPDLGIEPTGHVERPDGGAGRPADHAGRFLDRAVSWLRASGRLLERTRYLAVLAANLDAAFAGEIDGCPTARSPAARELVIRHAYCFHHVVLPELARAGIELVRWDNLTAQERESLHALFRERVYPVLTPFAVDPIRTLPNVPTLSVNLAVLVRDPGSAAQYFARVGVPPALARFVRVGGSGPDRFVPLEDVIAAHLPQLFSGMQVLEHHPFRVTRARAESPGTTGPPVRLEVEESITPEMLDTLVRELGVTEDAVHRMPGPLDLTGLACVANLDRPDLSYPPFVPGTHPDLLRVAEKGGRDLFAALRGRDILLHHPYDSFATSVQAFVEAAAADPDTLAIKLILGTGDPRIVEPLAAAAQAGKLVAVVVAGAGRAPRRCAASARVPTDSSPGWVRLLNDAGCQIGYGVDGARTCVHAALVVRRESGGRLGRYSHIGTGDYGARDERASTGPPREDIGLLTADQEVAEDLADLFNHLTGYARPPGYRRLLAGPRSLRPGLVNRIEREIGHHRAGRPARIRVKTNAVADQAVVEALYRAARVGVPVEVWVRDACVLRPGVSGLSETIRVRSVLGRFLEHSRILAFANGSEEEVWIGSVDLVPEDLDGRVGVFVRVVAAKHRRQLARLLDTALDGRTLGWSLDADGRWSRPIGGSDGRTQLDLHERLTRAYRP